MNHHATTVALGDEGVFIVGEPRAGKTSLALAAIAMWQAKGRFAALVADDQTLVSVHHGRLIGHAPEATAGLMELSGAGVYAAPSTLQAVRVSLLARLSSSPERMPAGTGTVEGISLPAIDLHPRQATLGAAVLWAVCHGERLDAPM
ncbi:MAG: HPr kinase/phosphorylase [Pseudomonadota bacterium]